MEGRRGGVKGERVEGGEEEMVKGVRRREWRGGE